MRLTRTVFLLAGLTLTFLAGPNAFAQKAPSKGHPLLLTGGRFGAEIYGIMCGGCGTELTAICDGDFYSCWASCEEVCGGPCEPCRAAC